MFYVDISTKPSCFVLELCKSSSIVYQRYFVKQNKSLHGKLLFFYGTSSLYDSITIAYINIIS